ncbi:MAG: GntR family transcriptional regulator [Solirubrobacteraceae bacterium]|nr:GntR family transcriptional regulator [Solirubrobacteraceae bacterium]
MVKPLDLRVPVARVQGRNHAVEAYRILQDALTVRQFAAGSRLPGERTLATQLGVSRATLRQVLNALADTGQLEPSPQRGWFVSGNKLVHEPNRLRGFTEVARESGLEAGSRLVHARLRNPTLTEAEPLGIDIAQEVVDVARVRSLDSAPISVEYSCLAAARVPGLEATDLAHRSLYDCLREQYDIVATRCDYELQAEAARARDAKLLGIAPGAPVLVGYQRTYDQNEQCFDIGKQVYRGDAYRFKASLFRF